MANETNVYEHSGNCYLEEMDDEVLLYNPNKGMTLHLNESSALVWKMINGKSTVLDIIKALEEQYPEAKSVIHADVSTLIDQLVKEQAIETI